MTPRARAARDRRREHLPGAAPRGAVDAGVVGELGVHREALRGALYASRSTTVRPVRHTKPGIDRIDRGRVIDDC